MSKQVLALDFDDLIYPCMDQLIPHQNEKFGLNLTVDDYHSFDFEKVWGGTPEAASQRVIEFWDSIDEHPAPIEGSMAAIDKLNDFYDLVIVTSREDRLRGATLSWISVHFPNHFRDVQLCNTYVKDRARSKADVCSDLGAFALVDDSLKNVTEAAARGIRGILFGDFAWNRADTLPANVTRAPDWDAVLNQLLENT